MKSYNVYGVYADNYQPYATSVAAEDEDGAIAAAQAQANEDNGYDAPLIGCQAYPSPLEFSQEEGDALVWLLDFSCDPRNRSLNGSRWPTDLKDVAGKLEAAGFRNPYPDMLTLIREGARASARQTAE